MSESILDAPPTTPPPATPPGTPPNTPAAASWRDSLPADLKALPSLQNFQDVGQLAKSYVHAQGMIGADKIPVPTQHATDEDWAGVFKKLGNPETIDKYDVKLAEGAPIDKAVFDGLKAEAHKAGILPKQFQKIVDSYLSATTAQVEAHNAQQIAANTKTLNDLKTEWGQGFEKNIKASLGFVEEFGGKDAIEHIRKSGYGNDPVLIRIFAKAGASLAEDSITGNGQGRMNGDLTPAEAQVKINAIMSDLKHPYFQSQSPAHATAVQEVENLYKFMVPNRS